MEAMLIWIGIGFFLGLYTGNSTIRKSITGLLTRQRGPEKDEIYNRDREDRNRSKRPEEPVIRTRKNTRDPRSSRRTRR